METPNQPDAATLLTGFASGDRPEAAAELLPLVYGELRALARHYLRGERSNHTLQPTALVHEAYLKLVDQTRVDWKGRAHFLAIAAQAMRRILVDHARAVGAQKRGGDRRRLTLDGLPEDAPFRGAELLELSDALDRLAALSPRQARLVELRFMAGLTVEEAAEVLGVSTPTAERDWVFAKAWLRRELQNGRAGDGS